MEDCAMPTEFETRIRNIVRSETVTADDVIMILKRHGLSLEKLEKMKPVGSSKK